MSSHAAGPWTGAFSIPTKFPSSKHYRGMASVVVGPARREFVVHKDLLIFYSDYFRAAFDGSFSESITSKIELLDTSETVFQNFHSWLYTRKLLDKDDKTLDLQPLFWLWIFGDRYQVPMLQNCVIDEIFAAVYRGDDFPARSVKAVYRQTLNGSPLRKAMIEILTYMLDHHDSGESITLAEFHDYFTVEVLQDVIKELDAARKNNVPRGTAPERDRCFLHVHGKDEHC